MQLTQYTDYSLRVLIYLMLDSDRVVTVKQIADFYGISHNHLVKVVHRLGRLGLVDTVRGRSGGVRLVAGTEQQLVGNLIRLLEPEHRLADCEGRKGRSCAVLPVCRLSTALDDALECFFSELNRYTLAEIVRKGPASVSLRALIDGNAN